MLAYKEYKLLLFTLRAALEKQKAIVRKLTGERKVKRGEKWNKMNTEMNMTMKIKTKIKIKLNMEMKIKIETTHVTYSLWS